MTAAVCDQDFANLAHLAHLRPQVVQVVPVKMTKIASPLPTQVVQVVFGKLARPSCPPRHPPPPTTKKQDGQVFRTNLVKHRVGGSFGVILCFCFEYFFGSRFNGFKRAVSQPVSRAVDPRGRRAVSQSVRRSARRSVSQSGSRTVGRLIHAPSARQSVSQSDSRSFGPPVFKICDEAESPNEGACLRDMVNRSMTGRV